MRIHINLSEDLVREIDEIAGKGNRSEYIANAAKEMARRERLLKTIREGAGILSADDYPHWATPEKVNAWLKDLRETPSLREDPIDRVSPGRERSHMVAEGPEEHYRTS